MQQHTTGMAQLAATLGLTPGQTTALVVVTCLGVIALWVIACWALSRHVVPDEGDRPQRIPERRP